MTHNNPPHRLRDFVRKLTSVVNEGPPEDKLLERGTRLLGELIQRDDWLPDAFAQPDPDRYQQYLLHCDAEERFSVVSFVWAGGQETPIHDHRVWGLVGILRGAELSERWAKTPDRGLNRVSTDRLGPGEVDRLSPQTGDIHRVSNALDDAVTVSIHVYGGNIGRVERSVYEPDGRMRPFVSSYSNNVIPNIWNGS